MYYIMWIVIWCMTSRLSSGPIWHRTDKLVYKCDENWVSTLFMAGNLFPVEQEPFKGCYQQAWPLQLDFQICFVVPIIAILLHKIPMVYGVIVCLLMIFVNIGINMYYTYKYDLTIGLIDVGNYYLLETIIMKPWTKL